MKIALVTDAWLPQVNGVVTTLVELVSELEKAGHVIEVIHPGQFTTRACPGYPGIDIAVRPAGVVKALLTKISPDAIHIATEGPLGWATRSYCLKNKLAFTTAFHTKFPEILNAALKVPLSWGYALFRHFHKPSSGVMVPTQGVLEMLKRRGFRHLKNWTHGVDMALFKFHEKVQVHPKLGSLPRPVSLFVGRVSYEKNIQAFLDLDVPGSKVVCGVGPLELHLKKQYPQVHWLGVLPRDELAGIYASADLFVMPSKSETFGLVMLEAMSTGTPVAAYPVDGPLEVLGWHGDQTKGGCLHEDLKSAWCAALKIPRLEARQRAEFFSWSSASQLFTEHLVSVKLQSLKDNYTTTP
jgi:glycosyltransferase involved in cell wall biosynthesis